MRALRPVVGERSNCVDTTQVPVATGLFARLRKALATRRQRRALMALDDRMLADIGRGRSEAYQEANRRFLDVPPLP
jgi:uncharacterized protein YjiS (DUF1127 family)